MALLKITHSYLETYREFLLQYLDEMELVNSDSNGLTFQVHKIEEEQEFNEDGKALPIVKKILIPKGDKEVKLDIKHGELYVNKIKLF